MPPTMTEIAREADVSLSLVSRFVNGDADLRISEERRERILLAQEKLGSVRPRRAKRRASAPATASNIAVPLNRSCESEWLRLNVINSLLYRTIEESLKAENIRLSINFFDPGHECDYLRELAADPTYSDGVFLATGLVSQELADVVLGEGLNHVSIEARAESFGLNTVTESLPHGYRLALRHLQELGHQHIGFAGPCTERYHIFSRVMREMGLPQSTESFCEINYPTEYTDLATEWRMSGAAGFGQWRKRNPDITAIICFTDFVAEGVASVVADTGDNLSLIGHNDQWNDKAPDAQLPGLTTIERPIIAIGQRCVEVLLEQILHKRDAIRQEQIPCSLRLGTSTSVPAPKGKTVS